MLKVRRTTNKIYQYISIEMKKGWKGGTVPNQWGKAHGYQHTDSAVKWAKSLVIMLNYVLTYHWAMLS